MSYDARPKDNPLNWSFRIGSMFGIDIRIHLLFIAGAFLVMGMALSEAPEGRALVAVLESLGQVGILFFIVLVHEFGHCWGARRTGGEAEEILLWPLGGLAMVRPKHTAYAHFITTVCGPLVNVIFCAVSAVVLVTLYGGLGAVPWNPLQVFMPVSGLWQSQAHRWLCVFFGLSYIILLFNLLPMYPLDGGRVLHSYLWPKKGYRDATLIATFVGMIGAIVVGLFALITQIMMLIFIAGFGYLTCHRDRQMAKSADFDDTGEFGYDFSKGYAAFDDTEDKPHQPGFLERRRQAKAEARQAREAAQRERHTQRVDEILQKVHRTGITSLTAEEKRILEHETERQRSEG